MKEYKIEFTAEAEEDLSGAYLWYQKVSGELANRFSSEAISAIETLKIFPNRFRIRFDRYRAISINNFPYLIFYRIKKDSVQIAKIWHTKRDYGKS